MGAFDGKVVLITGATAGMGRTTAVAFAEQGAKVAHCGRRAEEGAETNRLIEAAGGQGLFIHADVSRAAEVEAMIAQIEKTFGRLDFAFNNAAVGTQYTALANQTEEDYDRAMSVNLKGVWLCMKYQIPAILRAGGGAIVNNSSVGGIVGLAGLAIYTATKHGVIALTKSAALDYAKQNLRINAVLPGLVMTEMVASTMGGLERGNEIAALRQPIGRATTAEEIASTVMWLCSPGSSGITGQSISVDGGRTATA